MELVNNCDTGLVADEDLANAEKELLLFRQVQKLPKPYSLKRNVLCYKSVKDIAFYLGAYKSMFGVMFRGGEFGFDFIESE